MQTRVSLANIDILKKELGLLLPDVKSSHRVEAMARGLGWNTNAALRAELSAAPSVRTVDEATFASYLADHGFANIRNGVLAEAIARADIAAAREAVVPNIEREPKSTLDGASKPELPPRRSAILATGASGPTWEAWRNITVAAVNAGLHQGHYGLEPDDNRFDDDGYVYHFDLDGIPAIAYAKPMGSGGLLIQAALHPTKQSERNIRILLSGFAAGDGCSMGMLERQDRKHLHSTRPYTSFRLPLLERVAGLNIEPNGFSTMPPLTM